MTGRATRRKRKTLRREIGQRRVLTIRAGRKHGGYIGGMQPPDPQNGRRHSASWAARPPAGSSRRAEGPLRGPTLAFGRAIFGHFRPLGDDRRGATAKYTLTLPDKTARLPLPEPMAPGGAAFGDRVVQGRF